jgi:hypothetical protein
MYRYRIIGPQNQLAGIWSTLTWGFCCKREYARKIYLVCVKSVELISGWLNPNIPRVPKICQNSVVELGNVWTEWLDEGGETDLYPAF